eukprot:jgi/Chlat1/7078/Chrsp57S06775
MVAGVAALPQSAGLRLARPTQLEQRDAGSQRQGRPQGGGRKQRGGGALCCCQLPAPEVVLLGVLAARVGGKIVTRWLSQHEGWRSSRLHATLRNWRSTIAQGTSSGLVLSALVTVPPVESIGPALTVAVADLRRNQAFMAALWAWSIAQVLKVFTHLYKEGKWDFTALTSSGGMPSSHSALVMGVTSSVALMNGLNDTLFPVCLAFSLIVMYDAANVRWHAGKQAEVLNTIVADLFHGHPISEKKLKELLGHTPLQVYMGSLLGMVVAWLYPQLSRPAVAAAVGV